MFDKKKRNNIAEVDDSNIRILQFNKFRFVVGLQWEPIRSTRNLMKEVRRIGKERKLDVVAIRRSDSIQAGFAPKTKQKLRGGYSLVVTLASLLDGCCIAVIPVGVNDKGEEEFTLVGKTEKGGIHPFSDLIYLKHELLQQVIDLRQELRGNQTGLDIPVFGDPDLFDWITTPLNLGELLTPKNLTKDFRLKPLTWGMTKKQIIVLAATVVMLIVAVLFISHYLDNQAELKRKAMVAERVKLEEINKEARYQSALGKFKHPWITTPSIKGFLQSCSFLLHEIPLSLKGWTPTTLECDAAGMKVNLARPQNSTATTRDVVDEIKSKFGVDTAFFYNQTSIVGFMIKNKVSANGDDPMLNIGEQLIKAISLFQAVNVEATFSSVAIVDVKKNEFGEDLPTQDWQEYTFEVNTVASPELIFIKDDFQAMRLNKVEYSMDQSSKIIQYKIKGVLYGAR
jgi:hypothetical protein